MKFWLVGTLMKIDEANNLWLTASKRERIPILADILNIDKAKVLTVWLDGNRNGEIKK